MEAPARAHCDRAREIQDEACTRLGVGPIHLPTEVIKEMIREYSKALEIDPENAEALHDRAYWRRYAGDGRAARADYDKLLRIAPANSLAWYQRGGMRCSGGDHAGALCGHNRFGFCELGWCS